MTSLDDIVAEIRNGIDLEQSDRPSSPGMLPISRIETISEGVIDFSRVKYATPTPRERQKYQLQSGDILFSHINSPEHIGKTALFRSNKPLIHGINLLLLRVNHEACHPEYLNLYLKSFAVRARFRARRFWKRQTGCVARAGIPAKSATLSSNPSSSKSSAIHCHRELQTASCVLKIS